MKKALVLSTLISFAMICSCQKQDSTAETQLAQRKTELDAREETLVQREKAVEEREKAVEEREKVVAEREKAVANSPIFQSQRHAPDAVQAEAERQRRIQQLPPELRALIPDRSRVNPGRAETNPIINRRPVQTPRGILELQKKAGVANAFASPVAEVPQASSPSPSLTPQ